MPLPKKEKRNKAIYRDKISGMKQKDIMSKYSISAKRVYQILKAMGFNFYAIKE
jgi:Mor family transcriptional regulator